GASSLALTQFSAALRKNHGLPRISIKEMYEARTLRELATLLGATQPGSGVPGSAEERSAGGPAAPVVKGSSVRFALTGLTQLVCFLALALLAGWVLDVGYLWVSGTPDLAVSFGRAIVFTVAAFVGFTALPVLVKYWSSTCSWATGNAPRYRCGARSTCGSGWSRP
ncbi:MAG TPA: acyl carrier protein, partial [Pseudonocardia sp.]